MTWLGSLVIRLTVVSDKFPFGKLHTAGGEVCVPRRMRDLRQFGVRHISLSELDSILCCFRTKQGGPRWFRSCWSNQEWFGTSTFQSPWKCAEHQQPLCWTQQAVCGLDRWWYHSEFQGCRRYFGSWSSVHHLCQWGWWNHKILFVWGFRLLASDLQSTTDVGPLWAPSWCYQHASEGAAAWKISSSCQGGGGRKTGQATWLQQALLSHPQHCRCKAEGCANHS